LICLRVFCFWLIVFSQVNSFEQLTINFANEKLQQEYNEHMFKVNILPLLPPTFLQIEQNDAAEEGIDYSKVHFIDNEDVLFLIEGEPMGLIPLLDEECRYPKATDKTFLEKIFQHHQKTKARIQSSQLYSK